MRIRLFAFFLLLTACATGASRAPSSALNDLKNAELASKLRGTALKFQSEPEGDQPSLVAFIEIRFGNCEAHESYVECETDLNSNPAHQSVQFRITGDQRKFTARANLAKADHYSLDVTATQAWESQRWTGTGEVTGWVREQHGETAAVHESLSF